jgi:hypothetical protein
MEPMSASNSDAVTPEADPTDVSSIEEREIDVLLEMLKIDVREFDSAVRAWAADPDQHGTHVFRHPKIAMHARDAIERLIISTEDQRRQAMKPQRAKAAEALLWKLRRQREWLAPYVNLALSAQAEKTPRRRAERILGKVRYQELRRIVRDLEAGMSEGEALEAAKGRVRE